MRYIVQVKTCGVTVELLAASLSDSLKRVPADTLEEISVRFATNEEGKRITLLYELPKGSVFQCTTSKWVKGNKKTAFGWQCHKLTDVSCTRVLSGYRRVTLCY